MPTPISVTPKQRYPVLFMQVAVAWFWTSLGVHWIPLKQLIAHASPKEIRVDPHKAACAERYLDRISARFPLGKSRMCLRRSLVLFYFLNRFGTEVQIHFGVRPHDAKSAEGHCWLVTAQGDLWKPDLQAASFSPIASLKRNADGKSILEGNFDPNYNVGKECL